MQAIPTVQVRERATNQVITIPQADIEKWQLRGWQIVDGTFMTPAPAPVPATPAASVADEPVTEPEPKKKHKA